MEKIIVPVLLVSCFVSQVWSQEQTQASITATANAPFTTVMTLSVEDLWNMWIGPVELYPVNTTVLPTPINPVELIPPPNLRGSNAATGAQLPLASKNASWAFPKDFLWGVASASYQVEGAVMDEGRGPSIWDAYSHRVKGYIYNNDTGDITDNHYYLYKQDIARLAAIGVKAYSFSISWSRIFPFGRGPVNEKGLAHYDDVIDTCLEYGITPIATLYHWDLPLFLQNLYGGWLSEEIVPDYVEYARVVFGRYHDRVSHWFTFNEPVVFCSTYPQPKGYFTSPDIPDTQQPYFCGQSMLLAHSQAYHVGKSINSSLVISFKNNGGYNIPLTNSSEDAIATQRAWDFNTGWFANPVFVDGNYPPYLQEYVSTFLRPLNESEKAQLAKSADLFAIDAYAGVFYAAPEDGIEPCVSNSSHPNFPSCASPTFTYADDDGGWKIGYASDPLTGWLHKATEWLPPYLHYIQNTWKPSGIVVSEFGFTEPFEADKVTLADIRYDFARSAYYRDYLAGMLMAISEGVNVVGCYAWSFIDNIEWGSGYHPKFGMQYVNFTSQERHYKASFFEFVNMFKVYQEGSDS